MPDLARRRLPATPGQPAPPACHAANPDAARKGRAFPWRNLLNFIYYLFRAAGGGSRLKMTNICLRGRTKKYIQITEIADGGGNYNITLK